jgi:hypothetical protein
MPHSILANIALLSTEGDQSPFVCMSGKSAKKKMIYDIEVVVTQESTRSWKVTHGVE